MNSTNSILSLLRDVWCAMVGTIILITSFHIKADQVTHSYDNLNRLIRTDYGDGRAIEYTYDAAGNRLSQVVTAPNLNQAPIANAGPDRSVECAGYYGTSVTLDGSASYDPDGDKLDFSWTGPFGKATGVKPTVKLPLGATPIPLTVTDGKGGQASDDVIITVADTTPPAINSVADNPSTLKPADHKMVPVKIIASATDACDKAPICKISTVASNEPVSGLDPYDLTPDWQITGNLTLNLRAEQDSKGKGRVYTIAVQCADAAGNAASKPVTVSVPTRIAS